MYVLSNQSNSTHNIRESHAALHTEELRWGAQYITLKLTGHNEKPSDAIGNLKSDF